VRLALVLLAACWTAAPIERPHFAIREIEPRKRVECWSPELYAQWPAEAALYELIAKCDEMWPGDQIVSDSCVYMEMWRAYQELLNWTGRWFEMCSSAR
jgi:hypothetical protein